MKYGIYADIHGNLDATCVALEFLSSQNLDVLICLGDIVGYGAQPNECIKLIRKSSSIIIAGNHDWASVGLMDISYFNPYAKSAITWTRGKLSSQNKDFLKNLELISSDNNITAVHGCLDNPCEFKYIFNIDDARLSFKKLTRQVCFIAHTHIPSVFCYDKDLDKVSMIDIADNESLKLNFNQNYKYIVNVGSVGQPRDGNPRACFVIYDSKDNVLTFNRLDYPVKEAQKKIIDADLPLVLSERLGQGY